MILTLLAPLGQRLRLLAALSLTAIGLTGCAYHSTGNLGAGSSIDNPVERKFTWFSYLDAADIRNSCAAGGPDQYRLVYNGQYDNHVRTYEVTSTPSRQIVARARGTS